MRETFLKWRLPLPLPRLCCFINSTAGAGQVAATNINNNLSAHLNLFTQMSLSEIRLRLIRRNAFAAVASISTAQLYTLHFTPLSSQLSGRIRRARFVAVLRPRGQP